MTASLVRGQAGRRVVDVTVSATALVLLAVPLAIISLLVKLSSPGPLLFRQRRVGQHGRPFWLYKLRSMRAGGAGPQVTRADDPRVTRVGAWLRRWKIDELPQFWNVLRGDMSLLGPRPEVETFVRRYSADQRQILEVTPGIAGMAQLVFAHEAELLRGQDDPEGVYLQLLLPRKIAIDLAYEQRRTLQSDLRLLLDLLLMILGLRRGSSLELPVRRALGSEGSAGSCAPGAGFT
jgi:lipopolysaccharide/colanic/teichoic acid biosynthesis glycosyltransferase